MKVNEKIERLASQAEAKRRCFFGETSVMRKILRRRTRAGELANPYCNIYARQEYWASLNPCQRALHVIGALAALHPDWRFAASSAALVLGLERSWPLHADGTVFIATSGSVHAQCHSRLRYVFVPDPAACECQGVRVTTPAQTLVDCALHYSFAEALGIFDAAFRAELVTAEEIESLCRNRKRQSADKVRRLLHYADGRSENGGESLCRAVIIEAGFPMPELQQVFRDPANRGTLYRVDFLWRLGGGRVVALEFDGTEKYIEPSMTGGKSIRGVVYQEREREGALRRAGITDIVRVNYREVRGRSGLIRKLDVAGIPRLA